MGAIYPASLFTNSSYDNWLFPGESKSTIWTKEENKRFEKALAIFDENTPDRFLRIADMIPGKSVWDVMKQYKELLEDVTDIEAGLVPIPGYLASPFTLEWVDNGKFDPFRKRSAASMAMSMSMSRPHEQERKKGVPWTEDEHRRFLLGLQKHGKGDWRNISRNFVISKTPTQVASHAQKYFLRQSSGGKDKRRPSIHDITTANLSDNAMPSVSETDEKPKSLLEHSSGSFPLLQKSFNIMPKMLLDWSNTNGEAFMVFDSPHGRQNLYSSAYQGASAYVGSH
ncbi:transcription factor DIVARICATA-like [Chenopodium quinoa]|uniref:transcription factor DIVARICATA-like n=1 Tax=Chenopodium quinoa TaxID=63459 RepID=UPI000B77FD93|nr:transcription factor DIVARICATA-like [Chenopodium quinoa]